jgi:hypothetical protein
MNYLKFIQDLINETKVLEEIKGKRNLILDCALKSSSVVHYLSELRGKIVNEEIKKYIEEEILGKIANHYVKKIDIIKNKESLDEDERLSLEFDINSFDHLPIEEVKKFYNELKKISENPECNKELKEYIKNQITVQCNISIYKKNIIELSNKKTILREEDKKKLLKFNESTLIFKDIRLIKFLNDIKKDGEANQEIKDYINNIFSKITKSFANLETIKKNREKIKKTNKFKLIFISQIILVVVFCSLFFSFLTSATLCAVLALPILFFSFLQSEIKFLNFFKKTFLYSLIPCAIFFIIAVIIIESRFNHISNKVLFSIFDDKLFESVDKQDFFVIFPRIAIDYKILELGNDKGTNPDQILLEVQETNKTTKYIIENKTDQEKQSFIGFKKFLLTEYKEAKKLTQENTK